MVKKIFITLGIIVVLFLAAAIVLPVIYKDTIIQKVKDAANENMNAKVDFGDFGLSLFRNFPNFSFAIEKISVAGTGPFEKDTLAYIDKFSLTVDLMSVIKGEQFNVRSISIEKPAIHAIVLKEGKANWDIAKESTTDTVKPSKPAETTSSSSFKIALRQFSISDASIIYDDRQGNMYVSIEGLNFDLKGDMSQDFTSLETNTAIRSLTYKMDGIKYLNNAEIAIKANIDADLKNSKYTFKENEFRLNKLLLGLDGFIAMPSEDIDMDLKFFAKQTEFKELLSLVPAVYMRDFEKVKTSGKLSLEGSAKGTYRDSLLPAFNIKLMVENAMFQYPDLPSSVTDININLNISSAGGIYDNTVIDIPKFHMAVAKNPFDMKLIMKTPVSDPFIDCYLKCLLDLNKMKEVIPMEPDEKLSGIINADLSLQGHVSTLEKEQYDRFNATGKVIISALNYASKSLPQEVQIYKIDVDFTPKYVNLNSFDARMGESDFAATGKLENFIAYALKDDAVLKGFCDLKSKRINLNQLMSEEEEPVSAAPIATGTAAAAADTVPLAVIEVPKNIDFHLITKIDNILYDKMDITNASGLLIIKDRKVTMEYLTLHLVDGTMVLNGSYETKNPSHPGIDFLMDITDFDITKTFRTFNTAEKIAPVGKSCKGKFSSNMSVAGLLDGKMEPVLNTLQGGGKLTTKGVMVDNFEPLNKVADALGNSKLKSMAVSDINITFKFKDGRINVEPFDVTMGKLKANVSGSNGFDQSLDYNMKMDIPTSEFGSAGTAILTNLTAGLNKFGTNLSVGESVKVNANIGGTMTKPLVSITGLNPFGGEKNLKDEAKEKLKEETDKLKKEAEDKAKAEAERLKKEAEDKVKTEADRLKKEAEDKAKTEAERLKKEAEEKAKKEVGNQLKNLLKKPK